MADVRESVAFYFSLGLNYTEILQCLAHINKVFISMRTLKRLLKQSGLRRRKQKSDIMDVALFITGEVERTGQLHGYKLMHLKCVQNGLVVTQNEVRLLQQIIDPEGVAVRKKNRLRRRQYNNPGPDFMWHVDSYDKLKPYGICVNGCIDGFSRHIIWLEAYSTNSNPAIIASYFMEAVKRRMGCPKRIRLDKGTENGHIANMQRFMRYDNADEFNRRSFLYGSSNHNQRIECWWSFNRKQNAQFWMNLFQGLKDNDDYDGNFLDKNLIQFCFMKIIQEDLTDIVNLWNCHRIRHYRNRVAPSGRPALLYNLPHLVGANSHLCKVTDLQLNTCLAECSHESPYPCDRTVYDVCCFLMAETGLSPPAEPSEATELYRFLRNYIRTDL